MAPDERSSSPSDAADRGWDLGRLVSRLGRAFWIGLGALLAVAVTSVVLLWFYQSNSARALRSREIFRLARDIRSLVVDRETGIRDYLLGDRGEGLALERAARPRIQPRLDSLLAATADEPEQREAALQAQQAVAAWDLQFAAPALAAIADSTLVAPSWAAAAPLFARVSDVLGRLAAAEEARFNASLRRERFVATMGIVVIVAELSVLALLLLALRRRALRQAARLDQQQRTMEAQAAELQARAAELEREVARGRSLAVYLKTTNDELRDTVDALTLARAETRSAMREHEQSLATLDLVLASAPVGIALLDRGLRYERVNAAYAVFDGVAEVDHIGRTVRDATPVLDIELDPIVSGVLAAEQPRLGVELTGSRAGEEAARQWSVSAYPVRDPDGTVRGVGLITVDITDRRALERQLLQAQKMEAVGRLAGSIAHDFNNLLTAISAFAQFALESLPEGTPASEDVGQIILATERGSALTRRLLAFSRQQILQPRPMDFNRVVSDLEGMLQRLIGEDVTLVSQIGAGLWAVDADPGQIEQVLLNLAVNSRDAMPDGGTLTIETANVELDTEYARLHPDANPGSYVMLAVSDTGTGMDAATQARVFEPFFTTKPMGKGTGLGLSTVYGIVRQSGGTISMQSEPGRGTTFKVYFPRSAQTIEAQAEAPPGARKESLAPTSVLLVEDDASVRIAVHRVLERSGCTVHDADNGREALETLEQLGGWVDLVLTDVIMPEMGGVEFSQEVHERSPDTLVLFMSGYTAENIQRQELLQQGVFFVEKPFTAATLLAKVREALEGRGRAA